MGVFDYLADEEEKKPVIKTRPKDTSLISNWGAQMGALTDPETPETPVKEAPKEEAKSITKSLIEDFNKVTDEPEDREEEEEKADKVEEDEEDDEDEEDFIEFDKTKFPEYKPSKKVERKEESEWQKEYDNLKSDYQDAIQRIGKARAVEIFGKALVLLGAGLYGIKKGVDVSGVQFNLSDWKEEYQSAKDVLDLEVDKLEKSREAERERVKEQKEEDLIKYQTDVEKAKFEQADKFKELELKANNLIQKAKTKAEADEIKLKAFKEAAKFKIEDAEKELKAVTAAIAEGEAGGTVEDIKAKYSEAGGTEPITSQKAGSGKDVGWFYRDKPETSINELKLEQERLKTVLRGLQSAYAKGIN